MENESKEDKGRSNYKQKGKIILIVVNCTFFLPLSLDGRNAQDWRTFKSIFKNFQHFNKISFIKIFFHVFFWLIKIPLAAFSRGVLSFWLVIYRFLWHTKVSFSKKTRILSMDCSSGWFNINGTIFNWNGN